MKYSSSVSKKCATSLETDKKFFTEIIKDQIMYTITTTLLQIYCINKHITENSVSYFFLPTNHGHYLIHVPPWISN
jgi:hypothetical protein